MNRTDRGSGQKQGEIRGEGAAETVEAFVARLHDEGVAAGRQEAERLLREARREAGEIEGRAKAEAESLIEAATSRVEEEKARARAELELAARDAVLELREALTETLSRILARAAERELGDEAVVVRLLEAVVKAYARADAERRPDEIRVPRPLMDAVESWWLGELSEALRVGGTLRVSPVLEAGFEYRIDGGTVEVSVEATVAKLMELVRPRLRQIVADGAAAGSGGVPALSAESGVA